MGIFDRQMRDWDCYWVHSCALDAHFNSDLIHEFKQRPESVSAIIQKLNDCSVTIDEPTALVAVSYCRTSLRDIPPSSQSERVVLAAVRSNPMLLAYAKYQTELIAMVAVKGRPEALKFVATGLHTEDVVLAAVLGDPLVLNYANHQSVAIALEAVSRRPEALEFVEKRFQTHDVVMTAVAMDPMALEHAKSQYADIALLAVRKCPESLKFVCRKMQNDAVVMTAVQGEPLVLKDATYQTEAIALEAVSNNPRSLAFVWRKFQTDTVLMTAVCADPWTLEYAKRQPQAVILAAVKVSPRTLQYVGRQTTQTAWEAVSRDVTTIYLVSEHLRTERFLLKAVKLFGSSALNYIYDDDQTLVIAQAAVDRDFWAIERVKPEFQKQVIDNIIKKYPRRRNILQPIFNSLDGGEKSVDRLVVDQVWDALVRITGLKRNIMPDIGIVDDPLKAPWTLPDHWRDDDRGIFERLGEYFPETYEVRIYKGLIDKYSKSKRWPASAVFYIVLVHELAHAITHMGSDQTGSKWAKFKDAPSGVLEMFAQWYTYRCLHFKPFNASDVKIMNKMAVGQPYRYRTYLEFRAMDTVEMNRQLAKARMSAINCPEIICNFCTVAPATTFVKRHDTWLMKEWDIPSCATCAPKNEQDWLT